jgi:hypothetical protein
MMKQTSMQDRFNASVEKMKELFVSVVEAIMPIADALMPIFDLIGGLIKLINPVIQAIGAVGALFGSIANWDSSIYSNQRKVFSKSLIDNWKFSPEFLGTDLEGNPVGDVVSPASGRTTISTKEGGLLKLSPNDDVIAAPGAAKLLNKQSSYNVDMSETNNLLKQLVYKQGTIKIDNTEIGTAFTVNSYNIQ